jgi:hypothetical protein
MAYKWGLNKNKPIRHAARCWNKQYAQPSKAKKQIPAMTSQSAYDSIVRPNLVENTA